MNSDQMCRASPAKSGAERLHESGQTHHDRKQRQAVEAIPDAFAVARNNGLFGARHQPRCDKQGNDESGDPHHGEGYGRNADGRKRRHAGCSRRRTAAAIARDASIAMKALPINQGRFGR